MTAKDQEPEVSGMAMFGFVLFLFLAVYLAYGASESAGEEFNRASTGVVEQEQVSLDRVDEGGVRGALRVDPELQGE